MRRQRRGEKWGPAILVVLTQALLFTAISAAGPDGDEQPAQPVPAEIVRKKFSETINVVASPIQEGQQVTPFGSEVASVSSRQVEDLTAGDLASALRWVPGVTISRYNVVGSYGGGDGGSIFIRGQGSGRPGAEISTMIDGIPRFGSVWTHPLLDTLATDANDRIDVYKSAQPVLFGNMTFAGVDLIPKRIAQDGMFTRVLGAYGSFATLTGLVENGAKLGDWDYYVLASHRDSDGDRPNADGRVNSLYGRLGYALAKGWSLSVQVHSDDGWADDPGEVGAAPLPQPQRFAVKDALTIATLAEEHDKHSGSVKLFYDSGASHWRQWDGTQAQFYTEVTDFKSYGLHAQEHVRLEGRTDLVVGYDHDQYGGSDQGESSYFPQMLFRNDAAYAMVSRAFGTEVEVIPSAGVRYTDSREFGSNWSGQAGLVVRSGGTELHANVARAFNLPGVYAAVMYSGWGGGDSWKDLRPEIMNHAEVGVGQKLTATSRVDLTVFYDDVTDALVFVPPPPPPPVFANIGAYTERGAEATATFAPSQTLALFGGVTYLDPTPIDVPNSPKWSLVAGASWAPMARLRVHADAEWVDRQTVLNPRFASTQEWIGSRFLVNMKASYRLDLGSSLASEVFIAGENIADSAYVYRPGYPAPGRSWTGGVDLRF